MTAEARAVLEFWFNELDAHGQADKAHTRPVPARRTRRSHSPGTQALHVARGRSRYYWATAQAEYSTDVSCTHTAWSRRSLCGPAVVFFAITGALLATQSLWVATHLDATEQLVRKRWGALREWWQKAQGAGSR